MCNLQMCLLKCAAAVFVCYYVYRYLDLRTCVKNTPVLYTPCKNAQKIGVNWCMCDGKYLPKAVSYCKWVCGRGFGFFGVKTEWKMRILCVCSACKTNINDPHSRALGWHTRTVCLACVCDWCIYIWRLEKSNNRGVGSKRTRRGLWFSVFVGTAVQCVTERSNSNEWKKRCESEDTIERFKNGARFGI